MASEKLVDSHVSVEQCKRAIKALHTHSTQAAAKKQETELLPGKEQNIWLNVTVKKLASVHRFKPVKIPIAHPLVDPRTSAICLITKDPQRQYKDLLAEHGVKFISRVVGIEKLKGKFKPYEARRMLLKENGMFLADERIVPLLPKLLGTKWFEAKKQPIPVCLTRKDLKGELERAISSTYMNQNQGTCTSIKISTLSHTPAQILENLSSAIPEVIKGIKGGWDNIQSLLLKTNTSAALPVWTCDLDAGDGGRWAGLVAEDADEEDVSEMEGVVEEKREGKGKKRAVAEEETAVEEPKKKVKGANGRPVSVSSPAPSLSKPVPAADADAAPKSKKRKAADADAPAPPSASKPKSKAPAADAAPAPALDAGKGKKKAKSNAPAAAVAPPPAPESKKAKAKVAAPAPETESAAEGKKSKKAKPDADTPSAASVPAPEGKKSKKSAKADTPASASAPKKSTPTTPTPASTSLTTDELKQKRAGKAGERKKERIGGGGGADGEKSLLKSKSGKNGGGKSAKDGVMGRKKAQ
ncbi:ribosomal protein L1p/L10e family-domain-containing protein [Mycena alexandri]|uniref:Ribosomal L1 domain-containing protein 1 n=1 Tax=Mycena alexandri TaxID=1745969 RepID=A0AAD6XAV7_9AGAR|nr:ribosomal protein L1p/L10e family-domain-containing protein [Mycena alexandri]